MALRLRVSVPRRVSGFRPFRQSFAVYVAVAPLPEFFGFPIIERIACSMREKRYDVRF